METFLQSGEPFGCFCEWGGVPMKFWEDMIETDSLRYNRIARHRSFSPYSRLPMKLCQVDCRLFEPECFDGSPRKECHVVKIELSFRPNIVGTLDPHLTKLPDLEVFDLTGNKTYEGLGGIEVDGNIAVFEKATRLKKLNLPYTKVGGDLTALQNANELTFLNLANNTHVLGDLSRLRPVENLNIEGTEITCKGQDEPLRQILLQLGLTTGRLTDLKNVTGIERRMLSCMYEVFFLFSFICIHMVWFSTSKHVQNWSNWIMLRPVCHAFKGQAVNQDLEDI